LKRLNAGETTREIALSDNVAHTIAWLNKPTEARLYWFSVPYPGLFSWA